MFPCCHLAIWVGFCVRQNSSHAQESVFAQFKFKYNEQWKLCSQKVETLPLPPAKICVFPAVFPQTTILGSISFERFESPGIRVAAASYVAILMQSPSFYHKLLAQSRISCTEKTGNDDGANQILELLKGPNMPQHICNGRMNIQCLHQLKQSIETSSLLAFLKGLSEIGRVPFYNLVFTKTWAVSWGNRLERNPGSQGRFLKNETLDTTLW